MTVQLSERDDADTPLPDRLAEDIHRHSYTAGWLWGVACGAVAGGSFVGMAAWLISLAKAAIACPTC